MTSISTAVKIVDETVPWGPKVLVWRPRSFGRPPTSWTDVIKRVAEPLDRSGTRPWYLELPTKYLCPVRSSGTSRLNSFSACTKLKFDRALSTVPISAKYQLDALDSVDRRARRRIGDLANKKLQFRTSSQGCLPFGILYFGESAQKL
ncbi:jg6473 [Pararge aegeria aegeria]|uniref:Jg6473 protein n=1 Tax=Pararge aegeria aegeria TaxID=348720 RepID=A0A8S4SJ06_9NEOP|nr:jg6473 [Pararge aegeria aegeria]